MLLYCEEMFRTLEGSVPSRCISVRQPVLSRSVYIFQLALASLRYVSNFGWHGSPFYHPRGVVSSLKTLLQVSCCIQLASPTHLHTPVQTDRWIIIIFVLVPVRWPQRQKSSSILYSDFLLTLIYVFTNGEQWCWPSAAFLLYYFS